MMYKVMIIDDDVPMLKVLRQMIDWESLNLHVVGATYSSAKALEMFKETSPDIVISDIGLPQKNGIELAEIFTRIKPNIRIIFVTCHEDFHYAQQAVKLDVDDYLLKEQLTADTLAQSLKKSVSRFNPKEAGIDHKMSNYNSELYKQGLIQRVIDGVNPEATLAYAAQLGIAWEYPLFMLGVVHLNLSSYESLYTQKDLASIIYGINNIAVELSASYEGITPFMEREHLVIVYNYRLNLTQNAGLHFETYLRHLRSQCAHFLKVRLGIVTLKDKMGLQSIGPLYQQIVHSKIDFYENDEQMIAGNIGPHQNVFLALPQGFLEPFKPELERALLKKDVEAIHNAVMEIGRTAQEYRIRPKELIENITYLLRSMEMMLSNQKLGEELYYYLSSARRAEDMMELMKRKLVQIMQNRGEKAGGAVQEPKLQMIQSFIDQHLSENITSIDMAHYLFLNPSYFSRYFKRLTGTNFTDYVHQYKMQMAARMLKASSQTFESLSMALGYSDRTYFSKVFKKYIGMTPSEYKASHAAIGGSHKRK